MPPSISTSSPQTGAHLIASTLASLGITVVFGLVGIPVVSIADLLPLHGIKFLAFRNEQAASYAASVYGYLTGKPGVCLVVGGPGLLHALPGVGNARVNKWPMLLLAGSVEREQVGRGGFQELDAGEVLGEAKGWGRVQLGSIGKVIAEGYAKATQGVPGAFVVDLPADVIQGEITNSPPPLLTQQPQLQTRLPSPSPSQISAIASLLRTASSPLIVIGKGAAIARAEGPLRSFISTTHLPFLPTPMGKGVIPDSHGQNVAAARSTALKEADVVLLLGARLNWILHFGDEPKWRADARFVMVDADEVEVSREGGRQDRRLSVVGDVNDVVAALTDALGGWTFGGGEYVAKLAAAKRRNEEKARLKAAEKKTPLTYAHVFDTIRTELHALSPPEAGEVVYVSEGANTMDISRSIFPVEEPRLRLDAGTHATMGVGMGYAIAAWQAYGGKKKVVALEGDSAFGFSAMEVETMVRYGMDVLVVVMNNGGVYHGDADGEGEWETLREKGGLRSTSLGWETRYHTLAEGLGAKGWEVRTEEELRSAVRSGWERKGGPTVVNIHIESGKGGTLEFGWQGKKGKESKL